MPRTYSHGSRRCKDIKYGFDKVFDENACQQAVYEATAKPIIKEIMKGYNATVFAYGATGCGKTHTITGTPTDPGIIFLTMQDLFTCIKEQSSTHHIESSFSYLEVYNETIRDLLSPSTEQLDLREDENSVRVPNLSEHSPTNVNDVMDLIIRGNESRTKAATEANAVSSRSHAVLQIRVRSREKGTQEWRSSVLSIIDLAGSERASVTKNRGERLLEGANINRYFCCFFFPFLDIPNTYIYSSFYRFKYYFIRRFYWMDPCLGAIFMNIFLKASFFIPFVFSDIFFFFL